MASSEAIHVQASQAPIEALTVKQKQELYEKFGYMEGAHTIGVANFALSIVVAVRFPQYFWLLHFAKACVYLPWRLVRFSHKGMELYLLEFCYFNTYYSAIGCTMAFIRVFFGINNPLHPYNALLIRVGFAFANGALLLAVPIYKNKLAFHDLDSTINTYVHLSPPVMYWTLRWGGGFGTSLIEDSWPNMFDVCPDMHAADAFLDSWSSLLWSPYEDCRGSVLDFMGYSAAFWIVFWGLPYALLVFCCLAGWIERNNKDSLYKYTLTCKDPMGRMVNAAPESLRPLAYMMIHFAWTVLATSGSIIMWNSFILHTLYVSGITFYAVHNASQYMFRYVAAKQIPKEIDRIAHTAQVDDYQAVPTA